MKRGFVLISDVDVQHVNVNESLGATERVSMQLTNDLSLGRMSGIKLPWEVGAMRHVFSSDPVPWLNPPPIPLGLPALSPASGIATQLVLSTRDKTAKVRRHCAESFQAEAGERPK